MKKEKFNIKYSIYRPAGNDTAFVNGLEYTKKQKKQINDAIMERHANVEQVGFIDISKNYELQMAGGEFCGNATRSAASVYLKNTKGDIKIIVNSKDLIKAGVDENKKAWCEIPLYQGKDTITKKESEIYIVKMNGMVSVIIPEGIAKIHLLNKDKLNDMGMEYIKKYNLEENEAVGIMFCEKEKGLLKINPVVWVKEIDTLFYETACGTGTTAVCMVEAFIKEQNQEIDILQPSGLIITANILIKDGKIEKAIIKSDIETDGKEYKIEIKEN